MRRAQLAHLGSVVGVLLALAGACSDNDETKPDATAPAPTCTPEETKQLVADGDLSKLLAVAADEPSKEALRDQVAGECCPDCPTGSATDRPLLADTEACVSCAGNYSGGNPADHVRSCATNVCTSN